MAETKKTEGLMYKGRPLRRVGNLIYYGTMADKYSPERQTVLPQIVRTVQKRPLVGKC